MHGAIRHKQDKVDHQAKHKPEHSNEDTFSEKSAIDFFEIQN
jgi:hypothetical protein